MARSSRLVARNASSRPGGGSACAATIDSPVGPLVLAFEGGALVALHFARRGAGGAGASAAAPGGAALARARRELAAYFAGTRTAFDLPLAPAGTPFQRRVWEALRRIPYGATATYGEIAHAAGSPRAVRAVGSACARNPLAIVVPCHRVVGADGTLTGYAGGLARKRALLALEAGAALRTRGRSHGPRARSARRSRGAAAGP
ncbi:MAG TPA: methylated-DNA--[protein]-cysteine S-methyltransferase [bacterium]